MEMALSIVFVFQMKQGARDVLKKIGASNAQKVGWRDMWALVVVKPEHGEKAFNLGEKISKSPDFR